MAPGFPSFRPHPLVRGGHLQTIVGCYLPYRAEHRSIGHPATEHRVPLDDGDTIVLHDDGGQSDCGASSGQAASAGQTSAGQAPQCDAPRWQPGDPVAILVHGLGGCHRSGYMQRTSSRLRARGVRVFRMDLRGCGAGFALARHPIHAGRSEDAAAVLDYVMGQCPDSPVHLVGYSMGANIVLKLAGELGAQAPANLASVMGVSPPIDLFACSRFMQVGWNRIYERRFVTGLIDYIRRRAQAVPDALSRPLDPRTRRLIDFDNQFTAPLSGFADADEYYQQASSGRLLPHISVPALIVTAANDPIIPVQPFETARYSPTTRLLITPCGGHLGFIAARGIDPDTRWLDWRVADWITSRVERSDAPAPVAAPHAAAPVPRRLATAGI